MKSEILFNNTQALFYLVSCALNNIIPDDSKLQEIDLESVYKLAKLHSLESVSYAALETYLNKTHNGQLKLSPETRNAWRSKREQTITKDTYFGFEREKLFAFFEKQGIWYLPMKGMLLRSLYPINGWRQFTDNDILFNAAHRESVRDFMLENDYEIHLYGSTNHDVYIKKPFYNFELHVSLFKDYPDEKQRQKVSLYYKDIFTKLVKNPDSQYGYHMTNEDFYIYIMAHSYMHHIGTGAGLRTFVDAYVMQKAFENKLDRGYINTELEKLGMLEFEQNVCILTQKFFSPDSKLNLTEAEKQTLLFYASSGTHGSLKATTQNQLSRLTTNPEADNITLKAKLLYCFDRMFPPMDYYREYHPYVYKHKILIPFFLLMRFLKGVFTKKKILYEIRYIIKSKDINK